MDTEALVRDLLSNKLLVSDDLPTRCRTAEVLEGRVKAEVDSRVESALRELKAKFSQCV